MATFSYSETTCDVCGKTERFLISDHPWRRKVWCKYPDLYGVIHMGNRELDICDKCLMDSVMLVESGPSYMIQGREDAE